MIEVAQNDVDSFQYQKKFEMKTSLDGRLAFDLVLNDMYWASLKVILNINLYKNGLGLSYF